MMEVPIKARKIMVKFISSFEEQHPCGHTINWLHAMRSRDENAILQPPCSVTTCYLVVKLFLAQHLHLFVIIRY